MAPGRSLDFEFVLFASATIDYDYIMKLIAEYSAGGAANPTKAKMSREQLVGLIADASLSTSGCDHRSASRRARVDERIRDGYRFKAECRDGWRAAWGGVACTRSWRRLRRRCVRRRGLTTDALVGAGGRKGVASWRLPLLTPAVGGDRWAEGVRGMMPPPSSAKTDDAEQSLVPRMRFPEFRVTRGRTTLGDGAKFNTSTPITRCEEISIRAQEHDFIFDNGSVGEWGMGALEHHSFDVSTGITRHAETQCHKRFWILPVDMHSDRRPQYQKSSSVFRRASKNRRLPDVAG